MPTLMETVCVIMINNNTFQTSVYNKNDFEP